MRGYPVAPIPSFIMGSLRGWSLSGPVLALICLLLSWLQHAVKGLGDDAWEHWRFDADGTRAFLEIGKGQPIKEEVASFCDLHRSTWHACQPILRVLYGSHPKLANASVAPYDVKLVSIFDACLHVRFAEGLSVAFDVHDDVRQVAEGFCALHSVSNCDFVLSAMLDERRQMLDEFDGDEAAMVAAQKQCSAARARREHAAAVLAALSDGRAEMKTGPSADHYASLPPSRASCVSPSGPLRSCVLHDVYFVTGKGFVLLDGGEALWPDGKPPRLSATREGAEQQAPVFDPPLVSRSMLAREGRRGRAEVAVVDEPWALLWRREPTSHGHILHDAVIPLHWATAVIHRHDQELQAAMAERTLRVAVADGEGPLPHDPWFRVLTRHPLTYAHELPYKVCPPGSPVCRVRRLVVGLDSMGLVDAGHTDVTEEELQIRAGMLESFVQHALGPLGLSDDDHDSSGTATVTLIQRVHSRDVPNMEEAARALREALPEEAVVQVVVPELLPPIEQIRLVRRSRVVVAVEGGALDLLVFARPGLHVVAVGRDPEAEFPIGCKGGEAFTHLPLFHVLSRDRRVRTSLLPTMPGQGYNLNIPRLIEALKEDMVGSDADEKVVAA